MRPFLLSSLLFLSVGLSACGTDESSLSADEEGVVASMGDAAAWLEESPGLDGAVADLVAFPLSGVQFAPGDTFHPPAFWGRFRRAHQPVRQRLIRVEGDSAWVTVHIGFNGVFRVDTSFNGILDPGTKPLIETSRQDALFVRDSAAPHGWRLGGLSIRRFTNADVDRRTVAITSVVVTRNSGTPLVVTEPTAIIPASTFTSTVVGDTLRVVVAVTNTTGTDLVPPTQMFVHVRHLQPGTDSWGRFPMQHQEDGSFRAQWVVRRPGRTIVAVDAIDSKTLSTQSADDYRSDLWAVPVNVGP